MRNTFAVVFALTFAILMVNASQEWDYGFIQESDGHSTNIDLINSNTPVESELIFKNNLPLRRVRSTEDNGDNEELITTTLPLENSFTVSPSSATSDTEEVFTRETIDADQSTIAAASTEKLSSSVSSLDNDTSTTTPSTQTITKDESTVADSEEIQESTTFEELNLNNNAKSTTAADFNLTSTTVSEDPSIESTDISITSNNNDNDDDKSSLNIENTQEEKNSEVATEDSSDATNESEEKDETTVRDANGPSDSTVSENTVSADDASSTVNTENVENAENDETTDVETRNPYEVTDLLASTTVENYVASQSESSSSSSNAVAQVPYSSYNFLVYNDLNIPCTLASMNITLNVTYTAMNNQTIIKQIQVPNLATTSGTCGKNTSYMTLTWTENPETVKENDVTFEIVKEGQYFYINSIQVRLFLDEKNFPHATETVVTGNSTNDLKLFSASVKNGKHVCYSQTEVHCEKIIVMIKDVSLIAYNDGQDVSYNRKEEHCYTSKPLSIAAILGGILGVAATIGIIASYAWYRKRTSTFRSELP